MTSRPARTFARAVKCLRARAMTVYDLAVALDVEPKVARRVVAALRDVGTAVAGPPVRQGKRGALSRTWYIP